MVLLVQLVGEVLAGVVAAVLLVGVVLVVRLRSLTRRAGTFDCALRAVEEHGGGGAAEGPWSLGVARTGSDGVRWWRSRSLSPRPRWSAPRDLVEVERLGDGAGADATSGGSQDDLGPVILLRCRSGGRAVDLAMNDDAYTGFAAWLESLPPRDRGAVA